MKQFILVLAMTLLPALAFADRQPLGTSGERFWEIDGSTLILSGNGVISSEDVSHSNSWLAYKDAIQTIQIGSIITGITEHVFDNHSVLTAFEVDSDNSALFADAGVLFSGNLSTPERITLLRYPQGKPDTHYEIPSGVVGITAGTFTGCNNLSEIIVGWEVPIYIGNDAFDADILTNVTLRIPAFATDTYLAANGWKEFQSIREQDLLTVSESRLNFPAGGNTQSILVTTNTNWAVSVSDNAAWVNFDPASGAGRGALRITASQNTGEARSATVTVRGNGLTGSITLTQSAAGQLNVSTSAISFTNEGGTETFTVSSNASWTISSDADWATVSPTSGAGQGTVSISAPANSGSERTATIIVTADELRQVIRVSQEARYHLETEEPPYAEAGGLTSIDLSFNLPSSDAFEIRFDLSLPRGFILDEESTSLSPDLSSSYDLSVEADPLDASRWFFRVYPETSTRAASPDVYRRVLTLGCRIDPSLEIGYYGINIEEVTLRNLTENTTFSQGNLYTHVWVTQATTTATDTPVLSGNVSCRDEVLRVDTPETERISIYSPSGGLLYRVQKGVGAVLYRIDRLPRGVLLVSGSSGWSTKVIH
ncbi:MAG: BACON domain-containing protein [Tannerellaceae bacterium]|jgi:hypothetical protein|nr:BACON domain-containing protein [Tannerellaceae bacterium]